MSHSPLRWLLELRRQFDALAIAAGRFQEAPYDATGAKDLRENARRLTSQLCLALDLDYIANLGGLSTVGRLVHDCRAESVKIEMASEHWLRFPEQQDQPGTVSAIAAAVEKLGVLLREAESKTAADHQ